MRGALIADTVVATSAPIGFWLVAGAGLGLVGFQIWAIIDVARWPARAWKGSGLSQVSWVLRVVILGLFGSVWYVISPRPKLRAASRDIRSSSSSSA